MNKKGKGSSCNYMLLQGKYINNNLLCEFNVKKHLLSVVLFCVKR